MISGTVTDASGRILSGQTVEAFWNSLRHAKPLTFGLNCALGAALMRPYIAELAKLCDTYVSCYPNAGLPNPMSDTGFDETPDVTSGLLKEFAQGGSREYRGRLLRHDAGAHRGDREGARRSEAARNGRRSIARLRKTARLTIESNDAQAHHDRSHDAPLRPRAVQRHRRLALHQRRRAHQRDRARRRSRA